MSKIKEEHRKRITVEIAGQVLEAAMDLRAKREKASGEPTSLAGVVREAVIAQWREVIGVGEEP